MNELKRKCPNCGDLILYKTKSQLNDAIKKCRICKGCVNRLRKYSGSLQRECNICHYVHTFSTYTKYKNSNLKKDYVCKRCVLSNTHRGKKISNKQREILRNLRLGTKLSDEVKKKLSQKRQGKNNPCYGRCKDKHPMYGKFGKLSPTYGKIPWIKGKRHTENSLTKMRVSALNRIKGCGVISYNKNACEYFNKLNKERGWSLQHALNGGEHSFIGYSIDAYDKDKNIIVEYD